MKDMATIFEKIRTATTDYPVDVDGLAHSLGITVLYLPMADEISGTLVRKGELYVITVNRNHSRTRQRFTLAHELGHYIHHRQIIGDGVNDSKTYRTINSGAYFNPRISRRHETEANQFAAALLMPQEIIDDLRGQGLSVEEIAKKLEVSRQAASIRMDMPISSRT
jgi:Zn-dependent peptidase ImmA (M78 family)